MERFSVSTRRRAEFVDITSEVKKIVAQAGNVPGLCHVFVPHTTAGVTVNENADPSVVRDLLAGLARLVPEEGDYTHGEGNSDAHLKASMLGSSVTVPVSEGGLCLGRWQGIYFCEFDGPRTREVWVTVMGAPGKG